MPLLMAERYEPAFKTLRGQVRPGEPAFARAACLALVVRPGADLRAAGLLNTPVTHRRFVDVTSQIIRQHLEVDGGDRAVFLIGQISVLMPPRYDGKGA